VGLRPGYCATPPRFTWHLAGPFLVQLTAPALTLPGSLSPAADEYSSRSSTFAQCTPGRPVRNHMVLARAALASGGRMADTQAMDKMPVAGAPAPDLALPDERGTIHRLSDERGRWVVVYFYPKDDTPGCTKESCAFQDTLPEFKSSKAAVLGVSILDEASKARFADKYKLTVPLLADPDHEVADRYGVWQKKTNYGRSYMGIGRTTYLIGPDGKVAKRWDNVKVDDHAEAVLAAVNAL